MPRVRVDLGFFFFLLFFYFDLGLWLPTLFTMKLGLFIAPIMLHGWLGLILRVARWRVEMSLAKVRWRAYI